ncbi:hypothetical protein [Shewanella frigidimarina]|uniref:hypothetical protein n=1 Tax=Shewanella frigidimarina TaxID=56812 RepID=UPI003D7B42C3
MCELIKQLYQIVKRVMKVALKVLPDISPANQIEARCEVQQLLQTERCGEYLRICSDRNQQEGRRAYKLMLLEQLGIPFLLKLKRFIIDLIRAIKPQHGLSLVIPLVN